MLGVLWGLVLLQNVATGLLFGWDKWRAKRQGRRVPERTLLWAMFATGWIGGWAAMALFRHKTIKQPFRRWALVWTLVNPFWLLLWHTLGGRG